MPLRNMLGIILFGHAAFVAIQLASNFDDLRQSAAAFAAPDDPFWFLSGLVVFNALIIIAAASLGTYLLRARELKVVYVLPLAIVAVLYGGYSLAIAAGVFGLYRLERHRPNEI